MHRKWFSGSDAVSPLSFLSMKCLQFAPSNIFGDQPHSTFVTSKSPFIILLNRSMYKSMLVVRFRCASEAFFFQEFCNKINVCRHKVRRFQEQKKNIVPDEVIITFGTVRKFIHIPLLAARCHYWLHRCKSGKTDWYQQIIHYYLNCLNYCVIRNWDQEKIAKLEQWSFMTIRNFDTNDLGKK